MKRLERDRETEIAHQGKRQQKEAEAEIKKQRPHEIETQETEKEKEGGVSGEVGEGQGRLRWTRNTRFPRVASLSPDTA